MVARVAIVDDLSGWEEAGPSDIVKAMNEQDRGKNNQSKPLAEHKIIYQRVV
jgi:hypothetical protein